MPDLQDAIRPYEVGVASFSEQRHQELRLLAEQHLYEHGRALSTLVRRDAAFELTDVIAGPPLADGLIAYAVAGAEDHAVAQMLFSRTAVVVLADLMMGGLGVVDDRLPTDLEAEIATARVAGLAGALVELVQGAGGDVRLSPVGPDAPLFGDQVTVQFELCVADLRHSVLFAAPVRRPITTSENLDLVARTCSGIPVELALCFQSVQLSAKEVASLAVGDVLRLDHLATDPLLGSVDGKPLLTTRIGRKRRNAAVEVVDVIELAPSPHPRTPPDRASEHDEEGPGPEEMTA